MNPDLLARIFGGQGSLQRAVLKRMTDKLYWPREQELLLLSTQAPFDNQARDRFAEVLEGRIDWVSLIEVSYKHAVTPLLCRTLELVSDYLVPPDVLENARCPLESVPKVYEGTQ